MAITDLTNEQLQAALGGQQNPLAAKLQPLVGNPNVQNFLGLISKAEGTDRYGHATAFGGGMLDNLSDHPRKLYDFTQTDGKANKTSAAGKYQFLQPTWDDVSKQLGLQDFSPESQDLAAVELLRRNGALEDVLKGDYHAAAKKSGGTWASLPSSPYAQPKRTAGFIEGVINSMVPAAQAGQPQASQKKQTGGLQDLSDEELAKMLGAGGGGGLQSIPDDQLRSMLGETGGITEQKQPTNYPPVSTNPLVGFAAGLGHGVGEVAMGAQHYLGKGLQGLGVDQAGQWLVDDAKQGRERMAQEIAPYKEVSPYATGGGEIGGNMAATWPVGGLLGKAVSAAAPVVGRVAPSAVPYAEKLASALTTGGFKVGGVAPTTLAGKAGEMGIRMMGGGATGGATAGLVNPDDSLTGAMIGAALPPVASGAYSLTKGVASGAKSLVEPFYQGGREKIVGRAIRNVAGNSADDAIRAMETSQSAIPGVNYSAAEAANNPGIASLSRTATATDPVAMNELAQQTAANNAARIEALAGLAPDKAAAIEGRTSATEALYGAAKDKVVQITDNLKELLDRPSIKSAISKAQQLARENNEGTQFVKSIPEQMGMIVGENGKPLTVSAEQTGSMTGRAAHYIKMALDDMANASPMSGIGKNEVRSIANTRNAFLQEIEQQIPEYAQARKLFAELSAPVTQADMVEKIAERAVNPRGNLTLGGLSRALSDRTAKTVTGQQNATLAKVLAPEQLQTLRQIEADLLRQDFANTAGRGAGSDTVQKLAFTNMLNQAGIPQALRGSAVPSIIGNLLQRGGDAFYGGANKKIAELLAQSLVDPRQSAALARGSMTTPAMQQLINSLQSPAQLMYRAAPVMSAQ